MRKGIGDDLDRIERLVEGRDAQSFSGERRQIARFIRREKIVVAAFHRLEVVLGESENDRMKVVLGRGGEGYGWLGKSLREWKKSDE